MSVNSVNFSTVGAAPLKPNKNVSFAGQETQEPKKSKTGKYVAIGASVATIAAAVIFRKNISQLASKLWKKVPASVTNKIQDCIKKATDIAKSGVDKTKEAFQKVFPEVNSLASNIGTKISNVARATWKGITSCAKAVGKFFKSIIDVVKSWFAKPQTTPPVQLPPSAVV